MPKLSIDKREVEVPPGATILDAARKLGIDVPTLCFLEGYDPSTSCLVCMVKIVGSDRLVPACGTAAVDGMEVESETEEVHAVRRSALELLLSDHLGDCLAPCYFACAAHMDIPLMLRQIMAGDMPGAIATVKSAIAIPAVLGRICPAPCEKACRRRAADGAVAICRLKQFVADVDLAAEQPYDPPCLPASGKSVAIVGAGPTGLAAAYRLAQQGHGCAIFDENDLPGGRIRHETTEEQLPRKVLDAEIQTVLRLGVQLHGNTRIGEETSLENLRGRFDAVLVAAGTSTPERAERLQLATGPRGIEVDRHTFQTATDGVFAAGGAIRGKVLVVRSVGDGKDAAVSIDRQLSGQPLVGSQRPLNVRIGHLQQSELKQFLATAGDAPRRDPTAGPEARFSTQEAAEQAARCLHCDCRKLHTCKLRKWAELYKADPLKYKAPRRTFQQDSRHTEVIFEPGKCIDCGLCIQIAAAGGEKFGLTFVGRGFDVRVGVPLNRSLDEALEKVAARCVEACPTAALSLR
ncbi:MAG: 2Fe-2S iron-sulfur cluster-binding protein [Thermoguttaceae bacterium]